MLKYSFEFKLNIVLEYLDGKSGGYKSLANKYNVKNKSQVQEWVNQYEEYGEDALRKKMTKTFYSGEFKLRVIQYRHINKCSYREIANHFEIDNPSMIANWQRKYLEEGFEGLNKSIGRPKSMSKADDEKYINKSKNLNESEKEELIKLREENEFLRASLAYEKKLKALIQEREQKTKKKQK